MTAPKTAAAIELARVAIGPMSRATVDAAIEVAYTDSLQVMLIASRRQIESEVQGGGYVEGWTTREFAQYVRRNDPEHRIRLCRDHGGPWQHPADSTPGRSVTDVVESAFQSMKEDVDLGFSLIHIDTSLERGAPASFVDSVSRLLDLYGGVHAHATATGRAVDFEIGFEVQSVGVADPLEFSDALVTVLESLQLRSLPLPRYVVAQTGTKVAGARNIGEIQDSQKFEEALAGVRLLAHICHSNGVELKAHNMDYLSPHLVQEIAASGVDAANVAPEFGVLETDFLLSEFETYGLAAQRDEFIDIAVSSGRWKSWSDGSRESRQSLARLSGHYVFAHPRVRALRRALNHAALDSGQPSLDENLAHRLTRRFREYLVPFARASQQSSCDSVAATINNMYSTPEEGVKRA